MFWNRFAIKRKCNWIKFILLTGQLAVLVYWTQIHQICQSTYDDCTYLYIVWHVHIYPNMYAFYATADCLWEWTTRSSETPVEWWSAVSQGCFNNINDELSNTVLYQQLLVITRYLYQRYVCIYNVSESDFYCGDENLIVHTYITLVCVSEWNVHGCLSVKLTLQWKIFPWWKPINLNWIVARIGIGILINYY